MAVIDHGEDVTALSAVEIVPPGELYDYAARYTAGTTEFFCPARLTEEQALARARTRTYDFILKIAPVPEMLKKAAGITKGSAKPLQDKVGKVTKAQIREIAEKKAAALSMPTA